MRHAVQMTALSLFASVALAQPSGSPKYAADVPVTILTPDRIETRIGTLNFRDGIPDSETAKKVYDTLDFSRGMMSFLAGIPATSVYALCEGFSNAGIQRNKDLGIAEDLLDARSLFLTPNSTTVYALTCIDVRDGPMVVEVPPQVLGPINDAYFRYVADVGLVGADKGNGGKYLIVPPGYQGPLPDSGYFVVKSPTYTNLVFYRAFVHNDDLNAAVAGVKARAKIYPLSSAANTPVTNFVNVSGKKFNTVHANNFHFYEELNSVIQSEPADAFDPETVGLFASIGIKKGKPFAPDARMRAILIDAVAVGNAAARAILFDSRDPRAKYYADRQWFTGFIGGRYDFTEAGERMLDARTLFHYYATGITPAMAHSAPGSGSAYAVAAKDSKGRYFDGDKTYKVTLPAPIPARQFWSFTVYDNQTRSFLETDQKLAGIDSNQQGIKKNPDGSVTVWFAPKAPAGQEGNWVQTRPGKGWNTLLRLYGPLEPWFDKSWKPNDFELVE